MDIRSDYRSLQTDSMDNFQNRNRRLGVFSNNNCNPPPERRSTISSMTTSTNFPSSRVRNLSGGSSGSTASGSSSGSSVSLNNQYSDYQLTHGGNLESSQFATNSSIPQNRIASSSHRKLDRSLSDSDSDPLSNSSHKSVNSSRYKTELCRPFEESGTCKYGDKCQFAHGSHELRNLSRHPKYKTERCRTFHTVGFCPYGPRCHFIHADEGKTDSSPKLRQRGNNSPTSGNSSPALSPSNNDNDYKTFLYQADRENHVAPGRSESKQLDALSVNINSSSSCVSLQSLENQLNSALNISRNTANDNAAPNVFGGVFSTGSKKEPTPIGTTEYDIFKEVTMFNTEEVTLDNAPKAPLSSVSLYDTQSVKLDNYPSYVDTSVFWQFNGVLSQSRPVDSFHHSPTGSTASDGNSSDCSGSTESLVSSGYRDNLGFYCRNDSGSFSPFSQWIPGF